MLKISGPTNDEQKELVMSRLLGDEWDNLSDDEVDDLMKRECWKADKMEEWKKENGLSKKED